MLSHIGHLLQHLEHYLQPGRLSLRKIDARMVRRAQFLDEAIARINGWMPVFSSPTNSDPVDALAGATQNIAQMNGQRIVLNADRAEKSHRHQLSEPLLRLQLCRNK